jgi:hypothetical protein
MIARLLALALCGATLFPALLPAQAPAPEPGGAPDAPDAKPGPLFARIRGLFDIDLPQLDPKGTVKLTFRPHVADLVKRDYLRIATGARWAVTDNLELHAEGEVFATHGFGGGNDGYGIGEVRLGARQILRQWPAPEFESSYGIDAQLPTGDPPYDLTDGHNHVTPSFVIQHRWISNPKVTTFAGLEYDIVTPSSVRGDFGRNQPRDDSVSVTAGAVYDLGQLKWTLQATYASTWVSGRDENFLTIRPSVLWFVPRRLTFNMKTQWILGFGARSTWGPEGDEFSTSSRVRAEITFRQVIDSMRGAAGWSPAAPPR